MKYFLIILFSFTLQVNAQKNLVQLFETAAVNCKGDSSSFVYENDTLRIDYVFWANNGIMAFRILNKSDKPLYINWFKSAYIGDGVRSQYWSDNAKLAVNYEAIAKANSVNFPPVKGYIGSTIADKSAQEKISSIPPKSCLQKLSIYLIEEPFKKWGSDFTQSTVPRHDNAKVQTVIYSKQFTSDNSPLNFRNFLALSFKDDFSNEFYLDNQFYVQSVTVMERDHFWDDVPTIENQYQDYRDFPNRNYHITRFKRGTSFFLRVKQ